MSSIQYAYWNFKIIGKTVFIFITLLFLGHFLYRYTTREDSETFHNSIRRENLQEYTLTLFNSMKEQFVAEILLKVKEQIIHPRRKRDEVNIDSHLQILFYYFSIRFYSISLLITLIVITKKVIPIK